MICFGEKQILESSKSHTDPQLKQDHSIHLCSWQALHPPNVLPQLAHPPNLLPQFGHPLTLLPQLAHDREEGE